MAEEVLDNTLQQAVTKAVETHKEEIEQSSADSEEEKDQEEKEGGSESEEELNNDEIVQGKILIKALKDPDKASALIDFLATKAGYTKQTIQTREDVKEAKKDINEILERNLGDEFKFLAPKLAPAIKETLESLLESHKDTNSDLRARIEKQELREIQNETARTHAAISDEWFDGKAMPNNVVQAMSRAMDEFPPTDPNMSPERYYRRIFNMVAGELGLTKKSGTRGERIEKNLKDSPARNLSSQSRGVSPSVNGQNPQRMSLKDAVSRAVEEVNQSSRK